jgi:hypothetical protein
VKRSNFYVLLSTIMVAGWAGATSPAAAWVMLGGTLIWAAMGLHEAIRRPEDSA